MTDLILEPNEDFKPRNGGQSDLWGDITSRIIFLTGGWAGGKTWIGARKYMDVHLLNAFDIHGQPTGVCGAIVGPTRMAMMDYQLPAIEEACAAMGITAVFRNKWGTLHDVIVFPELGTEKNPSFARCRTAERPELITGWEVGQFWGDEAARWRMDNHNPKNDPYLQITGRLRDPRATHQLGLFTYTNEGDLTRVYKEAHSGKPSHAHYVAKTKDNESVNEFYLAQRDALTPELAEQYLDGGVLRLRGSMAYPQFETEMHKKPAEEVLLDKSLPPAVAFDFNINPGNHVLLCQHNANADAFRFCHEIHRNRLTLRDAMEDIVMMFKDRYDFIPAADAPHGEAIWPFAGPLEVFGDASGKSGWAGTGETCYQIIREALERHGVPYRIRVKKANPAVTDRLNAVNMALRDGKKNSHIEISAECPRLLADFGELTMDDRGEPDKSDPKLSHAGDAVGYMIDYLRPCRVDVKPREGRFGVSTQPAGIGFGAGRPVSNANLAGIPRVG